VKIVLPIVLCLAVVSSVAAQSVTIGTQLADEGGTATITSGAPVTYVDLAHYAPGTGTVSKATVGWSRACTGAFKIVFLRNTFFSLSSFTVFATRGPFDSVAGRTTVTLNPPVTIQNGDVIGVVQLQPLAACGSVLTETAPASSGYNLITVGDVSTNGGVLGSSSNFGPGYEIGVFAYGSDPVLTRILPAAGAVQGASAFFRTSLQLLNPTTTAISGTLVFHKQGQQAAAGDPSLPFTLAAHEIRSYPDVIATMGTSGLGSLDVLTNGGAAPVATARIFSDAGAGGTSGFSEEGLRPNEAADSFRHLALVVPPDLTNFRMNVGVRTLDAGATLNITLFSANGTVRATRSASYPANYFIQIPLSDFVGTTNIDPGGWISITSTFPSAAFIYSSVIDNRTSDSTYRLADVR
jgi:hypothetical protein